MIRPRGPRRFSGFSCPRYIQRHPSPVFCATWTQHEGNTTFAVEAEASGRADDSAVFGDCAWPAASNPVARMVGFQSAFYDQEPPEAIRTCFSPTGFSIDGGAPQGFDGLARVCSATITYLDGTTAEITAGGLSRIFQRQRLSRAGTGLQTTTMAALERRAAACPWHPSTRLTEGGDVLQRVE